MEVNQLLRLPSSSSTSSLPSLTTIKRLLPVRSHTETLHFLPWTLAFNSVSLIRVAPGAVLVPLPPPRRVKCDSDKTPVVDLPKWRELEMRIGFPSPSVGMEVVVSPASPSRPPTWPRAPMGQPILRRRVAADQCRVCPRQIVNHVALGAQSMDTGVSRSIACETGMLILVRTGMTRP
jgi:hypothetical protein